MHMSEGMFSHIMAHVYVPLMLVRKAVALH